MIRLEKVSHAYGERVVLRDVTLELAQARIGVIGANGSGKSTFARLLNGLVVPSSGTVTVDGLDTARDGAAVRRTVGFVFSDPDAQIVMPTVLEDVEFSLRRKGIDKALMRRQAEEVLRRFGLGDHLEHPAHLLSSGQKQNLALASVLVTNPRVLVCDEPTTLLDLRHTRRVAELLATLAQQVILVTHDLDLVADWDRVLVIDEAQVAFDGPGPEAVVRYRQWMAT